MLNNLPVIALKATTGTGAQPTGLAQYSGIIMIVAMFAIFYFMIIRPQRKKDKETKQMRDSIAPGDSVVTIGGINGKVVKVNAEKVTLELEFAKQRITFDKWAIGTVEKAKDAKTSADVKATDSKSKEEALQEKLDSPDIKSDDK